MTPAERWAALLTGQIVGNYRLERSLGNGSFGVVFEGVHHVTQARVAVKVLTGFSDPDAVVDFRNESQLLSQLNPCQGVVNFIDGGTHDVVMSLNGVDMPMPLSYHATTLASGSLDELVDDPAIRSAIAWDERLRLWRSAVTSLMQLHQHGVAHRDLKSSNCLLLVSKGVTRIRFGDLGRSRDLNLPAVHTPFDYIRGRGDFGFAAPEALFWQGGAHREDFLAADYYGLGSLMVELATGQSVTSLAIGDIGAALATGQRDFNAGLQRDLSTLNLKYRLAVGQVVAQFPNSVRADARMVLNSLCHPDPTQRLGSSPFRRDRASRNRLDWVLRRTDIMIRRIEIEDRIARRLAKKVSA